MSSPASSRPSPRPRSGSASTVGTKSRPPRNSRSRTESSRSPHAANPNARSATSRSSNFAARDSCQASTPTGSPPTACTYFRGSRKASPSRRTSCRPSACPPVSPPSTRCWSMATGQARPPWSLGRQGQGKRSWGCISSSTAPPRGQPGIIATLQENSTQLDRIVKGFGWSLASESVELMYRSPVDLYLDEWVYELHRGHRADPRAPGIHRQPRGPTARSRRRTALSRISLLTAAALRKPTDQRHDEPGNTSAVRHLPHFRRRHIPRLRQRHPAAVRASRCATTACRDGTQDPRKQTRSRRPRVHHHPGRHRPRRAAQQLDALTTGIDAEEQHALRACPAPSRSHVTGAAALATIDLGCHYRSSTRRRRLPSTRPPGRESGGLMSPGS